MVVPETIVNPEPAIVTESTVSPDGELPISWTVTVNGLDGVPIPTSPKLNAGGVCGVTSISIAGAVPVPLRLNDDCTPSIVTVTGQLPDGPSTVGVNVAVNEYVVALPNEVHVPEPAVRHGSVTGAGRLGALIVKSGQLAVIESTVSLSTWPLVGECESPGRRSRSC